MGEYFGVHINCDERIFGGRPIIGNHRITVHDVVVWHKEGRMQEELASDFELTLPEVRAALAYYRDHKDEVDRQLCADDEQMREREAHDVSPATERFRQARTKYRAQSH